MLSFRCKNISESCRLLLILIVMVAGVGEVKGQKVYATVASIGGDAVSTTFTNAQGASTTSPPAGSNATFTVTAGALSTKTGYLQLLFPSGIPLNSTVFIRFNVPANGTITAEAHKSAGKATGSNFYQTIGLDGNTYFAVTASELFDRVRIITSASGGLGAVTATTNVFYAYYNPANTADCGSGSAVYTASTGVLVTPPLPANPLSAIDSDPDSFAFLTLGLVGLVATVTEDVYFNGPSNGEAAKVTFSIPSTLLSLSLVNNINVQAYNGATAIGSPQTLSSLLGLDALNLVSLLGSDNRYTFYFNPGVSFDRIEFVVGGVVSVAGGINLYNVQRVPTKPTFNPTSSQNVTSCSELPVTLTPVAVSGSTFKWYNAASGGTLLATRNSYTPSPISTTTYYVATAKTTCTNESERVPMVVTINSISGGTVTADQTLCSNSLPAAFTSTAAATITPGATTASYQWQKSTDNVNFTNIPSATGLTYTETVALTATTYYRRVATSSLNSVSCTGNSNVITVTVNTINGGTVDAGQTLCPNSIPAAFTSTTAATIMAGGTAATYQWQKSTDNVTFNNIASATSLTYTETAALTATTYYRRVATSSLNSISCSGNSNVITVAVNSITAGTIGSSQVICSGLIPTGFTSSTAATITPGGTAASYQWQKSTDNVNFNNIAGATNLTYTETIVPTQNTYYRRVASSTLNSVTCSANTTSILITIHPVPIVPPITIH